MPTMNEIRHLMMDKYKGDFVFNSTYNDIIDKEILYFHPKNSTYCISHAITDYEKELSIAQFDLIVVYPAVEALMKYKAKSDGN